MMITEEKNQFFDLLGRSIIQIISLDGNEKLSPPFNIQYYKNKYSNLDTSSIVLFKEGNPIKTRHYKVHYRCLCGNEHTIHLSKFLIKNIIRCFKCRETEEKRQNHSKLLRSKNFVRKVKKIKQYNVEEHIKESIETFKGESAEYIKKYYNNNITEQQFSTIRDKIVLIDGKSIFDKKIVFLPPLTVSNQSKFSQYVLIDDFKTLLHNITFKCDNCDENFNTTRRISTKINNHKLLCPRCSFCNKIFKIRKYRTIFNYDISYQSKLELDFIQKCEGLNIKILNGLIIPYNFKNKKNGRKYRVDFLLPDLNLLVEIKGNHIWHRKQLNSGLWFAKQSAAENYCIENNLTYKLLFQEDIDNFFTSIKI